MNHGDVEVEIKRRENRGARQVYDITAEHGLLGVEFDRLHRTLGIATFNVEEKFQHRGIGKAMLRKSIELAQELEARKIHGAIMSRECFDAMLAVFGEEAVYVKHGHHEGTYTPPGEHSPLDAWAELDYDLPK